MWPVWGGALPAFAHAGGVDRQKMAPPGPAQTRPHCDLHCIEARSLQCPRQMGFSVRQLLQHSPQQMQPQLTLSLACGLVVTRVSMGRAFCDPVLAQMECSSGGKARLEGGSRTLVLPQHQAKFARCGNNASLELVGRYEGIYNKLSGLCFCRVCELGLSEVKRSWHATGAWFVKRRFVFQPVALPSYRSARWRQQEHDPLCELDCSTKSHANILKHLTKLC